MGHAEPNEPTECPYCGEPIVVADLAECPTCERDGCPVCLFHGRHASCLAGEHTGIFEGLGW